MRIFVCVKQVPDTSGKVAVNEDGTLNRASMATIINPDDLSAMEAALELKDATGCQVTAVTMGPMPAEGMLGAKIFYIFFALVGAGFAYCTFMWKLTSDSKKITLRRAVGTKKEIKYDQVKMVEVHKKKKNNNQTRKHW